MWENQINVFERDSIAMHQAKVRNDASDHECPLRRKIILSKVSRYYEFMKSLKTTMIGTRE